jgi:tetratricopeptide (TPR) repeat protein
VAEGHVFFETGKLHFLARPEMADCSPNMADETQRPIESPELASPRASPSAAVRFMLGATFIFLLAFAAYWPVLRGQFIWDDPLLVEKNPLVTHTLNLRSVWFQTDFPLTVVAFWLQWLSWGKAAAGYHTINILLHALNSILIWRLLVRLNIRGAWLAGSLFAVHPVCAASVAWISELKNTLSLPFFLSSIWFYLRQSPQSASENHASRITHHAWYALSLIAFLLALLAKTSTIMLPIVLLGCAWWRSGRLTKEDWLRTSPFFALSLAFGLMSIWFQSHQTFTTGQVQTENFWGRLAGAGMAVWFYLGKALLPLNLTPIYPRWQINAAAALSYLPVLLLLGAFLILWKSRRGWGRPLLFGFGYFVVTLFPVLGFFDMYFLAISRVADHFQYLPLIGIVGLAAAAIDWGARSLKINGAEWLVGATLIVALSFLTLQRARVMATDENLWRDTLAKNPTAWPAQNNFGCILAGQNKIDEAIVHFVASLRYHPNNAQAHCNLGKALTQQHKLTEAEAELRTAIALKPQESEFHRSLAYVLGGQGKSDEALAQLQQAADLDKDGGSRLELANRLHQLGKEHEAVAEYRRALESQPLSVEALNNLAWILATSGDGSLRNGAEAVRYAEKACEQTQNNDAMTAGTLAAAYAEAGRFQEAVRTAEKAANLAAAAGKSQFSDINRQLLQLYRTGKAYHERPPDIRKP